MVDGNVNSFSSFHPQYWNIAYLPSNGGPYDSMVFPTTHIIALRKSKMPSPHPYLSKTNHNKGPPKVAAANDCDQLSKMVTGVYCMQERMYFLEGGWR